VEDEAHSESLLETLKALTPKGFERICKRLLTEIGIHDIQITGGAGDQGIDGIGRIRLNDLEPVSTFPFGLREGLWRPYFLAGPVT